MAEQKSKNYDYLFKLVLVGDGSVGKSTIMSRFAEQKFIQYDFTTIGIDFKIRTIDINDKKVKLQIWDTCQQARFHTLSLRNFYRGVHGVMIVYSVTNEETFDNAVNVWMKIVDEIIETGVIKMMVGNKCDLEGSRIISRERGQLVADDHGAMFSEVSAKSGHNIDQTFIDIVCAICKTI